MEYLVLTKDRLPEGKEVDLVIKDLTEGKHKYECRYVRALLTSSPETMPGADTLWIRSNLGYMSPKPWAIKITKELGPLPPKKE